MDGVTFRDAMVDDLATIVAMYADDDIGGSREVVGTPVPAGYLRAFYAIDTDPRHRLVVAELDGEIVGTMQLSYIPHLVLHGGERAQLEAVRVRSDHRAAGLGTVMIQWAIDQARARRCLLVQLTTNTQRVEAQRFYAKLGFQPTHVGMKLVLDGH